MSILTVTLNPAIDQTVTLDRLTPGAVHRARDTRAHAGGKGINVASCLADWRAAHPVGEIAAYGFLGSDNAAPFDTLFDAKSVADRMTHVGGATRTNLKLVDEAGTTDINLSGAAVTTEMADALCEELATVSRAGDLVVLAGSVPPGCPPDIYATLTARLRERGCTVLLDTSGVPLRLALDADASPHAVKPNRDELAEWIGQPLGTTDELLDAAHRLHRRGVAWVVVSAGEDGALFVSREGALTARLPVDTIASTVGAGDAMVAGIAAALIEEEPLERIARLATAFAVGKLSREGPNLPPAAEIGTLAAKVEIRWLDKPETHGRRDNAARLERTNGLGEAE
ncbi:1-phosphofructokinase [uncultured Croceicoccus sp.]|uniref:1-phosphofructokinase n=1 Tax=uncultured Croceicoccus sp. TaxID=1295329 RepID=UPI002623A206|nr:1-phosphofructokinase [uncultured Croceicoccus sp.]